MKPAVDVPVTARDIAKAVLQILKKRAHPFPNDEYVVPSLFRIYMRESDDRRLEPLKGEIRQSVGNALDRGLARMNRNLFQLNPKRYRRMREYWQVDFNIAGESELQPGQLFYVWSDFPEQRGPRDFDGAQTVRATVDAFEMETSRQSQAPSGREEIRAHFRFVDKLGARLYAMAVNRTGRNPVKIGRGGDGRWVDIEIVTDVTEVSREHAAVRRDAGTGAFEIMDTSRFGTTVNGAECGQTWQPLPSPSRIVLAGTIVLDFEALPND
jgi:hypothetical protein